MERRLQAWVDHTPYHKRYKFVPLSQVSPDLQRAVIAAEDARFYQHHGFDWHQSKSLRKAIWKAAAFVEGPQLRSN
jgi:membrane peptidoglycan carboxypeptidase